jgi:hypothetical protein
MALVEKSAHKLRLPLLGIGIIVVALLALELTNTTHIFHHEKIKPTATTGGAYTKGTQGSSNSTKDSSQSSTNTVPSDSSAKQSADGSTTNTNLTAPWGTFANDYKVSLTDQMGSTCNTTPGAKCKIVFTNGSTSRSLDPDTADAGGAVYWSWTPSKMGLTPGTWHMTMEATLGAQTKTTSNDPLTLEVSQ